MLHHIAHLGLLNGHAAAGEGPGRAQAVEENGGAQTGDAVLVVADVQTVRIVVRIVDDVLGVPALQIQAGQLLQIHQFVVAKALPCVAGPVAILVHLNIGDGAARILGDAEGPVEVKDAGGRFAIALPGLAEAVLADEAGRSHGHVPAAIGLLFVEGDPGAGRILAEGGHNQQLIGVLGGLQLAHPRGGGNVQPRVIAGIGRDGGGHRRGLRGGAAGQHQHQKQEGRDHSRIFHRG